MKTPDTDTRVVDYLYDDLSDAERSAFAEHLDSDEDATAEAKSYQSLLALYREESEELTPSVAATERLVREAERATKPWFSRVFGELLPKLVMRPAMGVAMASVLLIGVGVFFVLSKDVDQGVPRERAAESTVAKGRDRTVAPTTAKPASTIVVSESSREKNGLADDADGEGRADKGVADADQTTTNKNLVQAAGGKLKKTGEFKSAALASRGSARRAKDALRRGRKARRSRRGRGEAGLAVVRSPRPSAPPRARPAPQRAPSQSLDTVNRPAKKKPAVNADRKLANRAVKTKQQKKVTPSAVHNQAKKNLAKGRVALACRLFSSLVSSHRSYSRRADALLGWARCELARGSYNRAEQLIRQLIKEYPKWKKSGQRWLAAIRRQRAQSQLRAQRTRKQRKTKARRRAPARRVRSAPTSN